MANKPTYEELEQKVKELEHVEYERKRVELKLKSSEKKSRAWLEHSPVCTKIVDLDFNLQYMSSAGVKDLQIDDITPYYGKPYPFDFYPESFHKGMSKNLEKVKETGEIITQEASVVDIEGNELWYQSTLVPVNDEKGRIEYIIVVSIDTTTRKRAEEVLAKHRDYLEDLIEQSTAELQQEITERKRTEKVLRESEARFRTLFSKSRDANLLLVDGVHVDCNEACLEMLQATRDQVVGKSPAFLSPERQPDGRLSVEAAEEKIREVMETGSARFEWVNRRMDGTEFWTEVVATVMDINGKNGLFGVWRDVTERKQAEEEKDKLQQQLLQAHKMEAIGTLAGGIAHDFNNILSVILGNTELAMDDVPEWNPARHNLEETKTASLRAKDLVQQLLSFSRKSDQKQKPVKISPIIKECLKFLKSIVPANIEIIINIPDESGIISADPTQIHQLMLNLCTNATHAMSENGGIMEVSLYVIDMGKDDAIQNIELNQDKYVKITVSDTGHGIVKEDIDRVFDPYFTTKEVGEGSGVGLSVVHGIVNSHHGGISVDSEYGKGTTFNVFLPVVEKEPASEEETDTTMPTGNERILLVDDDNSIANMTSQMLERLGYIVTTRNSSTDTLKTFRTRPDNFDLIISDMTMPEMTGDKLAKELQQIRPKIPIILCTGYSERINDEKAKSIGVRALVMKPIVKSVLAKTIRKVLD